MAEGQEDNKMEEDDWVGDAGADVQPMNDCKITQVYYDDDEILCDFWQNFINEGKNFHDPVEIWRRHFTKPFGNIILLQAPNIF